MAEGGESSGQGFLSLALYSQETHGKSYNYHCNWNLHHVGLLSRSGTGEEMNA